MKTPHISSGVEAVTAFPVVTQARPPLFTATPAGQGPPVANPPAGQAPTAVIPPAEQAPTAAAPVLAAAPLPEQAPAGAAAYELLFPALPKKRLYSMRS